MLRASPLFPRDALLSDLIKLAPKKTHANMKTGTRTEFAEKSQNLIIILCV